VTAVAEDTLAETRAFNAALERAAAAAPPRHTVPLDELRRARREGTDAFPPPVFLTDRARELTIPARGGDVVLRAIAPRRDALGAYLYIHGGGWALGAADLQDAMLAELADETGLCAVSVEYRLAPEHPYPACADDCEDAALWLVREGFDALGVPRVAAIGGDSAGGHLSAMTLLRLRDRHGTVDPFVAANLIYGVFDLSLTPSTRDWGERPLILTTPMMRRYGEWLLPGTDAEAKRAPDVSPLYADLRALPPALFTVGTLDPLLDDSLFMEARWGAAGGQTELRVWPEAIHGFNLFRLKMTAQARAAQYAFLRARLPSTVDGQG
jgi:acetyl esterase/lipase